MEIEGLEFEGARWLDAGERLPDGRVKHEAVLLRHTDDKAGDVFKVSVGDSVQVWNDLETGAREGAGEADTVWRSEWIARVEGMWEIDSERMFRARWYYKKRDIERLHPDDFTGLYSRDRLMNALTIKDLILSEEQDDNNIDTISRPQRVFFRRPEDDVISLPRDSFFCRYSFAFTTEKPTKLMARPYDFEMSSVIDLVSEPPSKRTKSHRSGNEGQNGSGIVAKMPHFISLVNEIEEIEDTESPDSLTRKELRNTSQKGRQSTRNVSSLSHVLFNGGAGYQKNLRNEVQELHQQPMEQRQLDQQEILERLQGQAKEYSIDIIWIPDGEDEVILNATEMELGWLGEESMYCLYCTTFQWDFIWAYASPNLKVQLLKVSSDIKDEVEKINSIIRHDNEMVAKRFPIYRGFIRVALGRGYRRDLMRPVIAKLRLSHVMTESNKKSAGLISQGDGMGIHCSNGSDNAANRSSASTNGNKTISVFPAVDLELAWKNVVKKKNQLKKKKKKRTASNRWE